MLCYHVTTSSFIFISCCSVYQSVSTSPTYHLFYNLLFAILLLHDRSFSLIYHLPLLVYEYLTNSLSFPPSAILTLSFSYPLPIHFLCLLISPLLALSHCTSLYLSFLSHYFNLHLLGASWGRSV